MTRATPLQVFIDGNWIDPVGTRKLDIISPVTEEPIGKVALGTGEDVDRAVASARQAFAAYAATSVADRIALLQRIQDAYKKRFNDMGAAISAEMGAPLLFAQRFQAGAG